MFTYFRIRNITIKIRDLNENFNNNNNCQDIVKLFWNII